MTRAIKMKVTRDWGRGTAHLQLCLDELKKNAVRIHPIEEKLNVIINDLEKLFADFVQCYPEESREGKE